jgi:hypothetical protein
MMSAPESDEVAAHQYRLAQANRLLRFCRDNGVDPADVMNGQVQLDLDPICGVNGKITPEPADYDAVR